MEIYVNFNASISHNSVMKLRKIVEDMLKEKIGEKEDRVLHLMIYSPGGDMHDALSIYNFLKRSKIKIITYNMSAIDSAAILLFCAGEERESPPEARFSFHPMKIKFPENKEYEIYTAQEQVDITKSEQSNVDVIIAKTIGKDINYVNNIVNSRRVMLPKEAFDCGLVTRIGYSPIPWGTEIISIYNETLSHSFPFVSEGFCEYY